MTRVVAGPDPGTVILVGGGDPTLTALPAGKEGVYPDPSRLTALADAVRKAATAPVRRVLVDTSRYSGPTLQPHLGPGGRRRRVRHPDRAADARRRPRRTRRRRTARASPTRR